MSVWKAGLWIAAPLLGAGAVAGDSGPLPVVQDILRASPHLAALIVIVVLFLRHIERQNDSFERMMNRFANAIDKLEEAQRKD